MSISRDPVFFRLMQTALQKANPSGLPSNQVLTQFAMPADYLYADESIKSIWTQIGYPYGWGEMVATSGAGTYSLTEPMCDAWLLRLNAQKGSSDTVTLQTTIGTGSQFTVTRIDPAQAIVYADNIFDWSAASMLGIVGMNPWGTPTGWTDTLAMWLGPQSGSDSSAPIGEWGLQKWVWFGTTDNYTFSCAADDTANVVLDGSVIITGATSGSTSTYTTSTTAGWHLVSVSCINQGSSPNPTGVLLSITDSQGDVIEDGSDSTLIGSTWQTSGFINPTWTTVSNEDSMRYAWYVIPASQITSDSISLVVSATGSPVIHGIWWYNVAPWKWDAGGQWNATASSSTPAQTDPSVTTEVVG